MKTAIKFVVLFLLLSLSGCTTLKDFFVPEVSDKDANVEWQKTLKFSVNDVGYRGVAVLPKAPSYHLKIYPSDKTIDRFQWRTCEGGDYEDKVIEKNFWGSTNKDYHEMDVTPTAIELDRACTMKIESLSGKHKIMDFGWLIFPSSRPEVNITATLHCARVTAKYRGKSGCEAPEGAIYRIQFENKVYQDESEDEQCPPLAELSNNLFEGFVPKAECVYLFMSLERHENGKRLEHILHTYGWEKSPPPEYKK